MVVVASPAVPKREHLAGLLASDPAAAARQLIAVAAEEPTVQRDWVNRFRDELAATEHGDDVGRVLRVWALSNAEAGRLLGVSRQAVAKWRTGTVPAERAPVIGDLAAVTDLLVRYVRPERIPAVVRRPAEHLAGMSMLDWVAEGRTRELLALTRDMFDLHRLTS